MNTTNDRHAVTGRRQWLEHRPQARRGGQGVSQRTDGTVDPNELEVRSHRRRRVAIYPCVVLILVKLTLTLVAASTSTGTGTSSSRIAHTGIVRYVMAVLGIGSAGNRLSVVVVAARAPMAARRTDARTCSCGVKPLQ